MYKYLDKEALRELIYLGFWQDILDEYDVSIESGLTIEDVESRRTIDNSYGWIFEESVKEFKRHKDE